jgi:protein O-mannosyl-transferase
VVVNLSTSSPHTSKLGLMQLMYSASSLQLEGKFEEAKNIYKEALHIEPQNVLALIGLAASLCAQGHIEDAELQHIRALEIEPRNFTCLVTYAKFLFTIKKNYQIALEKYAEALKIQPNDELTKSEYEKTLCMLNKMGKN